jgi:hypothetical protein
VKDELEMIWKERTIARSMYYPERNNGALKKIPKNPSVP